MENERTQSISAILVSVFSIFHLSSSLKIQCHLASCYAGVEVELSGGAKSASQSFRKPRFGFDLSWI